MAIKNQNNCAINSRKNYSQQNRSNGQLKDFGNSCKVLNKRKEEECENLLFLSQGKSRGIRVFFFINFWRGRAIKLGLGAFWELFGNFFFIYVTLISTLVRAFKHCSCVRVEDILWWICFIFTIYYFDLPATFIFSRKINRFYLRIMALCVLMIVFLTFLFTLLKNLKIFRRRWIIFSIQFLTIFFFILTPLSFCLATWDEFNVWSIYIAYVGTQSALALIAVL
ncbi:unnamed protein product [Meloidogyne enterolobii]|uniref:Uncharacterized protein n=1 Tax=Meloidogyne enterolobii TaxID=390850 RepID=A0ACB1ARN3_MELEN